MAQRAEEESSPTTSIEPHLDDVLLGRRANAFNHPGNQRYRHLITQNLLKYAQCKTRLDKGILTEQVTKEILDGGRVKFLRLQELSGKKKRRKGDEDIWTEIPYRTVHGKVAHALRDGVTKMTFPTNDNSIVEEKNTAPRTNYLNEPCRVRPNISIRPNICIQPNISLLQAQMKRDTFHESIAMKTRLEAPRNSVHSSQLFSLASKMKALEDEFTAKKTLLILKQQQELRAKQNNETLLLLSAISKTNSII